LRNVCLTPSLHHAEKIPGESREPLDEKLGIYRFDDLVVLKSARMPAVLFEAGVIVNRNEELLLRSATHQKKLASALAGAVADFCDGRAPQWCVCWRSEVNGSTSRFAHSDHSGRRHGRRRRHPGGGIRASA
jgi:hypothetical protein